MGSHAPIELFGQTIIQIFVCAPQVDVFLIIVLLNLPVRTKMALLFSEIAFDREAASNLLIFLPESDQPKIQAKLNECESLFKFDRHFDLLDAVKELLVTIKALENDLQSVEISVDEQSATTKSENAANDVKKQPTALSAAMFAAFVESSPMFVIAQEKVRECQRLSDDIEDHTTWAPTTSIDDKGYGTYYRAEAGKNAHSFKVIGEVQESILHVVSVIMELDLYTEWFPCCCDAEMQGELTRFHKSSRFVVQVPWPMDNREVFLVGYGVDDLTNRKRVIITSRSVSDDEQLHPNIQRPPVGKKCTRISVEVGGFMLEALSPTVCKVSFIMNVDPQIPHVPLWLVNWVSGKMIWVLLHQMDKAAKRAGKKKSKYTDRRHNRPDIYEHLQRRAVEVYAQHFPGAAVPPLDKE